jgi:C1A family cysteine protease
MNRLVILAALAVTASAIPAFKVGSMSFMAEEDALFQRFKNEHGKAYFDVKDESYRKSVFVSNLRHIREHNAAAEAGEHTFTLAMNEFGDLTFEEFHAKYTGFSGLRSRYLRSQNTANLAGVRANDEVDWSKQGAVTDVKNQGQCGSCWAFSATGSIEGAWYISKGKLVSLSEQQLMDCSKSEGNNSCEGGLMDYAFEYVISHGGLCSEADYPYQEKDRSQCDDSSCQSVASISSYKDVQQSEDALKTAVTQQPVSVAIEADQSSFQFYSSGVLTGSCGTNLDHGVLAVGYGTMDSTAYWKVKNSWGPSWGMDGYVLIERNKAQSGGQCGILMASSYPVV